MVSTTQTCTTTLKTDSSDPSSSSSSSDSTTQILTPEQQLSQFKNRFYLYFGMTIVGIGLIIGGLFIRNNTAKISLIIIGFLLALFAVFPTYQYYLDYTALDKLIGPALKYPSPEYMLTQGAQCPDGWIVKPHPTDSKKVVCENINNIPVSNRPSQTGFHCYDNEGGAFEKSFNSITEWPPKATDLAERCNFIQYCGPNANEPAIWTGINCDQNFA